MEDSDTKYIFYRRIYCVTEQSKKFHATQIDCYSEPVEGHRAVLVRVSRTSVHHSYQWGLVKDPSDYFYSSAIFYEQDLKLFPCLKDLREEF